jgi:hypothetical protein
MRRRGVTTGGVHGLPRAVIQSVVLSAVLLGCGRAGDGGRTGLVDDVQAASAAVEAELGGPQEFFEITATEPLTNVFVAVDGATAAIPFVYRDGALEAPGPVLEGASGFTFRSEAIDVDEDSVLLQIADELPDISIESFSVEGGPDRTVRYVVSARSQDGGLLDVVVGPRGAILSVEVL